MQNLAINNLRPEMVFGWDICDDYGDVTLGRSITLANANIDLLQDGAFSSAYISDGFADDVQRPKILSEQIHVAVCKRLYDLFSLVGPSYSSLVDSSCSPDQNLAAKSALLIAQLSNEVQDIIDEVFTAQVVDGLISLKSHDNYSFEHSLDVAVVAVMLGKRLQVPPDLLHQLALGSILHDMGKLFVPIEVLAKSSPLSPAEFDLIKQHTRSGYEILRDILPSEDVLACQIAWQHHERQDGSGYPRRLRGHNRLTSYWGDSQADLKGYQLAISEIAAVADVYSALSSDRPYRRALDPTKVIDTMRAMAGSHLNREILESFLSILPAYPVGSELAFTSRMSFDDAILISRQYLPGYTFRNGERPLFWGLYAP